MSTTNQSQGGTGLVAKEKAVRNFLSTLTTRVEAALPKTLESPRLFASVLGAFRRVPKLYECSGDSVQNAVMQAAFAGWEVDGPHAKAHLIPFKSECTLIPNYRGLIDAMMRSGQVSTVSARVVFERDDFGIDYAQTPPYWHRPHLGTDPGHIIGAYADVRMKDGSIKFDWMNTQQIDEVKASSPASRKKDSPWNTGESNWGEMAKKTLLRRISKQCPFSSEDLRLIFPEDDTSDADRGEPVLTVHAESKPSAPDQGAGEAPAQESQEAIDERAKLIAKLARTQVDNPEAHASVMGERGTEDMTEDELRESIRMVLAQATGAERGSEQEQPEEAAAAAEGGAE